jgi:signal peptidase I
VKKKETMSTNRVESKRDGGRNKRNLRRAPRWVTFLGGAFVVFLIWAFLMPPALGGGTSLMVTRGQSMEPVLHANDLAIVRKQSSYKVGDVVMYHSPTLNVKTMHRIVSIEGGKTVTTKGDNNTWLDEDHPTFAQIDGKMISHLDGVGRYVLAMHSPWAIAVGGLLVVAAIAWALWVGNRDDGPASTAQPSQFNKSALATKRLREPRSRIKRILSLATAGTVVFASMFAGFVAFRTPTTVQAGSTMYDLKGLFGYSARASGENAHMVYVDGQVSTGDPIYQKMVDQMLVTFDFTVDSPSEYLGGGTIGMKMEIIGQSGWNHSIKLAEPSKFEGGHTRIAAVISLREVSEIVKDVSALTKVPDKSYSISFKPDVKLDGTLGGTKFTEGFTPSFALTGTDLQLKLDNSGTAPALTQPKGSEAVMTGSMKGLTPNRGAQFTLEGGGATKWGPVSISLLRVLSLLGLAIGVCIFLAVFWMYRNSQIDADHEDIVEGDENAAANPTDDFAHLIVRITGIAQAGTLATVVNLPTLHALAQIATRADALILHEVAHEAENYLVNTGGTTYRYSHKTQSGTGTRPRFGASEVAPVDVEQ